MGLFGLLALGAVGVLSGFIPLPKSGDADVAGSVTVWGTLDGDGFEFAKSILGVKNKNITFKYVERPLVGFDAALSEAIASGQGPDLVILTQEQLLRNRSKLSLQSIDAETIAQYKNTYINGADVFLEDSAVLAYPLGVSPLMMFYNDRLMTSAGFAVPPEYWDQMSVYADKLTQVTDNKDVISSLVALGSFNNVTYPVDIVSALIMQTGNSIVKPELQNAQNGQTYTAYKSYLGTPATAQVLSFFNAFSNSNKELYSWNNSLLNDIDAFTTEFSSILFAYPTDKERILKRNPNLNLKVATIPQIRNTKTRLTYGKVYAVAMVRSTRNATAARIIQNQMITGEVHDAIVNDTNLQYPFRVPPTSKKQTPDDVLYARAAVQTVGFLMPSYDRTYALFKNILTQLASGKIDDNAAAKNLEQELNNALN